MVRLKPGRWAVSQAFVAPEYQGLWRDLLALFPFWEGSDGPHDVVRWTKASVVGAPLGWTISERGPSFEFELNPSGTGLEVPASSAYAFDSGSVQTFAALVNPKASRGADFQNIVFEVTDAAGSDGWGITIDSNDRPAVYTFGGNTIGSGTPLSLNSWHLIVAVYDQANNTIKVYADGELDYQDTSYTDNSSASAPIVHLASNFGQDDHLVGAIAFAGYWNRELTASEVRFLYADPFALARPNWDYVTEEAGGTTPTASGTVEAVGELSATGHVTLSASGTVEAEGELSAAGHIQPKASGTVSAEGELSATGHVDKNASGTVEAEAQLSASGHTTPKASGTVSAVGELSATGSAPSIIPEASGTVEAEASLSATGHKTPKASGVISAEGSLQATGHQMPKAAGTVEAVGFLEGVGYLTPLASGVIEGIGVLVGVGRSSPIPFAPVVITGEYSRQTVTGEYSRQTVTGEYSRQTIEGRA